MNLVKHPAGTFAILLLVAVILRCDTFGDPSLHGDEAFYWTVGNAMHHGALPYVDVWDRKPFGLFAIYWLISGISASALAYQLGATLASAVAAWAIAVVAERWSNRQGGLIAGALYLLWLAPLQGYGGQSPVFYNAFIALAAWLVIRALPDLRSGKMPGSVAWAMLLAGCGITIKTTALFEAAFLGLFATYALAQAAGWRRALPKAALWAAIGAAPSLAIAGAYLALGHWQEFWHAMVTSNLAKPADFLTSWIRLRLMFVVIAPPLALALFGLLAHEKANRRLLLLWLAAAFVSLLAVANFYIHYAMPLLIPLSIAAAPFLARRLAGPVAVAGIALLSFNIAPPFQFEHTRQSRAAMEGLVKVVKTHDAGRDLLTFEGPAQLYLLSGKRFVSPLVFPTHLSALIEKDVSHVSTLEAMTMALALKPGVVVIAQPIHNGPVNAETEALVRSYVARNCNFLGLHTILERTQHIDLAVWGDCRI
jgi:hypothetical protein